LDWERSLVRHRAGIYAFIRRKGFSAEDADDLTQETLLRAYAHVQGFRGTSVGGWLYRIAGNLAIDCLRKRRLPTVPLEDADVGGPTAFETDFMDRLTHQEARERFVEVLTGMPECHRRIIVLRYFEECSLAEIAAEVGCTPLAAKLRVFRAVSALRKRCRALPRAQDGRIPGLPNLAPEK
jgi:RNA polymerase sigma-70 factor (ECF subfamily)